MVCRYDRTYTTSLFLTRTSATEKSDERLRYLNCRNQMG